MPLQRRLPKRGFKNLFKKEYEIIHIRDLNKLDQGSSLDVDSLKNAGLIRGSKKKVKILGDGEISTPIEIRVHKVTRTARQKIETAGGKIELIE